ncbi:hypothetical protein CDD83_9936 [Cordyceps sp. RAO-2017]|nr:hypothetical protein CDD83_9936 [Cordyceps sp. RAO-2017]
MAVKRSPGGRAALCLAPPPPAGRCAATAQPQQARGRRRLARDPSLSLRGDPLSDTYGQHHDSLSLTASWTTLSLAASWAPFSHTAAPRFPHPSSRRDAKIGPARNPVRSL